MINHRTEPPDCLSRVTSAMSPLQAPAIALPAGTEGKLRITFLPGKCGPAVGKRLVHARDLEADLDQLQALGTTTLAGFTEADEMLALKVPPDQLSKAAQDRGVTHLHHPIRDVTAPEGQHARQAALTFAQELARRVESGETVTVYCRGGLGRSGMMAGAVLTALGVAPAAALQAVRSVRPGAIETHAQEEFVHWTAAFPPIRGSRTSGSLEGSG
jgi:ADP-ribosyl-[dinitrogen reductase] hydrolase